MLNDVCRDDRTVNILTIPSTQPLGAFNTHIGIENLVFNYATNVNLSRDEQ